MDYNRLLLSYSKCYCQGCAVWYIVYLHICHRNIISKTINSSFSICQYVFYDSSDDFMLALWITYLVRCIIPGVLYSFQECTVHVVCLKRSHLESDNLILRATDVGLHRLQKPTTFPSQFKSKVYFFLFSYHLI